MKILYAYRYGIVGGVSTQLLLRKKALEDAGSQCDLFFSQDNGLAQVLPVGINGVFFGGFSVFRRLVKNKYDAIVVIDTPELLSIASGSAWRRSRVFLDVHTTTETGLSYLESVSFKHISGVMVPSAYSEGLVGRKRPDCQSKLHVIPNLLNTQVFHPEGLDDIAVSNPQLQFIWVGKLDKHKNWRLALVYASMLKQHYGDIHLYMVGGYTARAEVAESFFELAYRLDISDSVTWLDRVENIQLAELYRQCARSGGAMLVTSRDESFGMAAAEALLCGCPLVSNDLPVFREVFPESPMLQLVDIWQPEQVLNAINNLSDDGISIKESQNMYKELSARYGASAFIAALEGVLSYGK